MIRILSAVGLLLCTCLLSGCNGGASLGDPVDVTATFMLDGQPLADADVTFTATGNVPADKRTRTGKTDAQGTATLTEVYPAEYMVRVNRNVQNDPENPSATTGDPALAKYSADSPLRATVSADKTSFTFNDLTSD